MALQNFRGTQGYSLDVTGQTLFWKVGHILASRVQGLNSASGAGVLKCSLSDREEEGGWLSAGSPVEPLSDSFGVGGKRRGD